MFVICNQQFLFSNRINSVWHVSKRHRHKAVLLQMVTVFACLTLLPGQQTTLSAGLLTAADV